MPKHNYPILNQAEVDKLPWKDGTHALVNRETRSIWLEAQEEDSLLDSLRILGPRHPMYSKLQLVSKS
jgi:hypothetical protein